MTLEPDTSQAAPSGPVHSMTLYGIREEHPGPRWQALHDATRDAYHRWYLSEGAAARPDLPTCHRMLMSHMPEFVFVGVGGGGGGGGGGAPPPPPPGC
jgi:hypothetical protein